jgi:hypothetical protein
LVLQYSIKRRSEDGTLKNILNDKDSDNSMVM